MEFSFGHAVAVTREGMRTCAPVREQSSRPFCPRLRIPQRLARVLDIDECRCVRAAIVNTVRAFAANGTSHVYSTTTHTDSSEPGDADRTGSDGEPGHINPTLRALPCAEVPANPTIVNNITKYPWPCDTRSTSTRFRVHHRTAGEIRISATLFQTNTVAERLSTPFRRRCAGDMVFGAFGNRYRPSPCGR